MVQLMSVYVRWLVDFDGMGKWNSSSIYIFRFRITLKTDLNFAFCFSLSPDFEKRIWTLPFIFRFRITLKNGYEFRFFVFALLWKTDLNFVYRFRITLKNGFEFRHSFLYGLLLKNRSEFCLSFLHGLKKTAGLLQLVCVKLRWLLLNGSDIP